MTTVCALDELEDGGVRRVEVDGEPVVVVRVGSDVYALSDICSHAHVSLSEGEVWCDELELECPKHGSTFSLLDGTPSTLPATQPVAVYDASVVDGQVHVTARRTDGAPAEQVGDGTGGAT